MGRSPDTLFRWVFYSATGLLFVQSVLRSWLIIDDGAVLLTALLLLGAWLAVFVAAIFVLRSWTVWLPLYLVVQSVIIVALLLLPGSDDYFAVLFGVLAMQALQYLRPALGFLWLLVFVPLMFLPLLSLGDPAEAATLTLVNTVVNVLLGSFAFVSRTAVEARRQNDALGRELQIANIELRERAAQLETLAVARERNRMARKLHDSITQTVFSMTLASKTAAMLMQQQPGKVAAQLERLGQLTQNALAEMHVLVSGLEPDASGPANLATAIRADILRRKADGLDVSLEVEEAAEEGLAERLTTVEQAALIRITQEALNNVVKHSAASQARVHLQLGGRPRLEIVDEGRGFDTQQAGEGAGMGLAGMRERATEIGWIVDVFSRPGHGTRVVAEREATREGGDDDGL